MISVTKIRFLVRFTCKKCKTVFFSKAALKGFAKSIIQINLNWTELKKIWLKWWNDFICHFLDLLMVNMMMLWLIWLIIITIFIKSNIEKKNQNICKIHLSENMIMLLFRAVLLLFWLLVVIFKCGDDWQLCAACDWSGGERGAGSGADPEVVTLVRTPGQQTSHSEPGPGAQPGQRAGSGARAGRGLARGENAWHSLSGTDHRHASLLDTIESC